MSDILKGTKRGEARLLRKGETLPENAIKLTDNEMYDIQLRRIERLKSKWEMKFYTWGGYWGAGLVGLSGLMIEKSIRQNFRMGSLSGIFTKCVATVVPAVMTVTLHEMYTKKEILLGRTSECSLCSLTKSGAIQAMNGVGYTYLCALVTCWPIARDNYTLPQPGKTGYLQLIRKVSPPAKTMLLLTGINFVAGALYARKSIIIFEKWLSEPPKIENWNDEDVLM